MALPLTDKYVRRNIIDLRKNHPIAFGKYIVALRNLELSDDWSRICGIHGNTFNPNDAEVKCPTNPDIVEKVGNTPDEPFYCAHSETRFIAWHTPYIYQYELLLNKHNTSKDKGYITLPYLFLTNEDNDYAFVNEPKIDIVFDGEQMTMDNPLAAANVSYYDEKGNKKIVTRNGFLKPKDESEVRKLKTTNKELNNVLYAENYPMFSSNNLFNKVLKKIIDYNPLEIPHNNIHDFIGGEGGNMSEVSISAYDPLFWMHHCNMDRFFYNWLYNKTNHLKEQFLPPKIPEETLKYTLSPFTNDIVYNDDFNNYVYGWQNDNMDKLLTIKDMLDIEKYPYTYDKIDIKPYKFPTTTIEIVGMPIPHESTHIEVLLFPKDVVLTEENKKQYIAGSATWFGINRYTKNCKRCNCSRTNMKIDIEEYMLDHNISSDDLKDYKWLIEGKGRLHPDENNTFKIYSQEELVKDGTIELFIKDDDNFDVGAKNNCCIPYYK
jgi:hypothetical protein